MVLMWLLRLRLQRALICGGTREELRGTLAGRPGRLHAGTGRAEEASAAIRAMWARKTPDGWRTSLAFYADSHMRDGELGILDFYRWLVG